MRFSHIFYNVFIPSCRLPLYNVYQECQSSPVKIQTLQLHHMSKGKIIGTAGIVVLICMIWVAGLNLGLAYAKPDTLTFVKDTSQISEKRVYVEVDNPPEIIKVTETVYVEPEIDNPVSSKDMPVKLKDWDSLEQLKQFLKEDDTDRIIFLRANSDGIVALNGICEDLAFQLRDRAAATGRYLSVQALDPNEYQKWYSCVVERNVYHAICMARIGNEFWYIEPSTDDTWLALYLD